MRFSMSAQSPPPLRWRLSSSRSAALTRFGGPTTVPIDPPACPPGRPRFRHGRAYRGPHPVFVPVGCVTTASPSRGLAVHGWLTAAASLDWSVEIHVLSVETNPRTHVHKNTGAHVEGISPHDYPASTCVQHAALPHPVVACGRPAPRSWHGFARPSWLHQPRPPRRPAQGADCGADARACVHCA